MKASDFNVPLPANAEIDRFLRVKMNDGYISLAGNEPDLGTTARRVVSDGLASSRFGEVIPRNCPCPVRMVANGPIDQFANVYSAAAGKVGASGSVLIGMTMTEATGDEEEIEVLRIAQ